MGQQCAWFMSAARAAAPWATVVEAGENLGFGRAVNLVARRIESGICHVNSSTVHDEPQMPFGGVKASGWGRFGGKAALEEFTELRWMTVQQTARHYPI